MSEPTMSRKAAYSKPKITLGPKLGAITATPNVSGANKA